MMKLPIFPLPIYLLPNGITQLRIFEQRYLNMVRDIKNTNGFAISYSTGKSNEMLPTWASKVEIVDFDMTDDGVLIIDVRCTHLVNIEDAQYDENKLLTATVSPKLHWSSATDVSNDVLPEVLNQPLKKIFSQNTELNSIYKETFFDDPLWVCSRWLELIPVSFQHKSHFTSPDSFDEALQFIETILTNNQDNL